MHITSQLAPAALPAGRPADISKPRLRWSLLVAFATAGCSIDRAFLERSGPEAPRPNPTSACEQSRSHAADSCAAGDFELARIHYCGALLSAADPCARAVIARELADVVTVLEQPAAARNLARERLHDHNTHGVEQLLHTARRHRDDPAADYALLSTLRHQEGDACSAWANALLAREHKAEDRPLAEFTQALWRTAPVVAAR